MGASGSGKSTVAKKLAEEKGWRILRSYTTRPKRHPGETGHIFVQEEDFQRYKGDLCAYTEFDGHKYWATKEQVNNSDLYIIDPTGVEFFREKHAFGKFPVTMKLVVDPGTRMARMRERGDTEQSIVQRLDHDKAVFSAFKADKLICAGMPVEEVARQIYETAEAMDEGRKGHWK